MQSYVFNKAINIYIYSTLILVLYNIALRKSKEMYISLNSIRMKNGFQDFQVTQFEFQIQNFNAACGYIGSEKFIKNDI